MPESRAATAICSAPLLWPSRPGLPTSILSRRPRRAVAASTCSRTGANTSWRGRGAGTGDAGGRAVLAEHLAQGLRPLAGGDAGMGAGDRGRHDVAAFLGGGLELGQGAGDGLGVAGGAVRLQALDLLGLGARVDGQEAAILAGGQRRGCGLGVAVDAHHLLRARGDGGDADGGCSRPGGSSCSRSRPRPAHRPWRRCGPAPRAPPASARPPCRPPPWSRRTGRGTPAGRSRRARICCMRSDHCWSHGRGRPRASFQAGSWTARARAFRDSVTASISSRMR